MADSIRIRAARRGQVMVVRAIIRHPMETGFARDPDSGAPITMHFIREVVCRHGADVILRCDWSRAVSRNPYLSFEFTGANSGDTLSIEWRDNRDQTDAASISLP